jgi:hypothetical protein
MEKHSKTTEKLSENKTHEMKGGDLKTLTDEKTGPARQSKAGVASDNKKMATNSPKIRKLL